MSPFHARLVAASSSLKPRIVLGTVAALALGIVLVTTVVVRHAERDTLGLQRQRELAEAVHAADLLSHRVIDLQRALNAAVRTLDRDTAADDRALERALVAQPVLRGMFSDLDVFSAEGRMRLYVDIDGVRRPNLDLHDREYFRRTMQERRAIVSEPVRSRLLGTPVVLFTEPMQDAKGVFGVLAGTLQLSKRGLIEDLVEPSATGTEATVVVTDSYGRVLAGMAPGQVLQTLARDPRFAGAFAQWQASGSAAEPAGITLAQPGMMVSVAGVAGPEWIVWRAQPEAALLAPLAEARRDAVIVALVLLVLLSLAAWAFLSVLLRPLAQLEHRARHLFDGTLGLREGWPQVRGEIGGLSRVLRQVAMERAQLEEANLLGMKKLESVMTAAPVGIAFTRDSRFELVSAEFCRLFGYTESELLGRDPRVLHESDDDIDRLGAAVEAAFAVGDGYVGEWRLRHADGHLFWASMRARRVDRDDPGAGKIWTVTDIGEQIARREQLEWSALHDMLTGVGNRHAFEQALIRVFEARPRSVPAAVVIIDLDHFKPVNDSAGHAAGDAVLKAVAQAIGGSVRNSDLVARVGGDEFGLVLERCPADVALRVAENVRHAVHSVTVPWAGRELRVGASVGVAPLTLEMEDVASWVEAADAACYEAKAGGRGTVRTSWPGGRRRLAPDDAPVA
jgi:diguanylate cyclase (GGDEF)-like protein/PAS domain S-box-containing protein